ncbi:MAG: type II toxin-antitoxin system VapC family toxin [Chloroflexi bacterium]|nr:type II toxin-antitoxin system VapC family toxin [Chloroflexota bacterium]
MLLLDTHVLLWLRFGDDQLGTETRKALNAAWVSGEVAVSALTFWEVALLRSKNRLDYIDNASQWRRQLIEEGLTEIPLDGEIGILANMLPNFHADPADRIIVATALEGRHYLVTSDERILRWESKLPRVDARE